MSLPWTKFQDFYLRLGFLKVAVAVLSPQRRSAFNDAIIRRLERPLFDAAIDHAGLWGRIGGDSLLLRDSPEKREDARRITVVEGLLLEGRCPSLLFAITRPTAYKILDWAHDVQFVGRGNQIMERGLALRRILDEQTFDGFLAGDVNSWNPFQISTMERNFFLYHLVEIDGVIGGIIDRLGKLEPGTVLESRDAARITCQTLISVLSAAGKTVQPKDILAFRTASDLAATIAQELGEDASALSVRTTRKMPRLVSPKARRKVGADGILREPRRANKNADHQTIPRFEQLVDLGFVVKPQDSGDPENALSAKRRWRYMPTEACRRWSEQRSNAGDSSKSFLWHGFARACLSAFGDVRTEERDAMSIGRYLWRAYERVKRPVGPNPVDTVALFATLEAIEDGAAMEMADFHRLLLSIKQAAVLTEHVFFSSGNDIDNMFIQLRPGFTEELRKEAETLNSAILR